MNAETLLRLTEFDLRVAGDSVDVQDVVDTLAGRMRAIGVKPMTLQEADNARFEIRELRAKRAAAKGLA
jgi:hypothetical protein